MSKQKIQAVRGMHDIGPQLSFKWRYIEQIIAALAESYGYQAIRLPIVEKTALFKHAVGEATDIVGKEMYTFVDGDESLSLRPEGTAGCVRAVIADGDLARTITRLWYCGPFFRRERPQQGRQRQFHQAGFEVFGINGPEIDAELIMLTARLFKQLRLDTQVELQINSIGSPAARQQYRKVLVAYLQRYEHDLDDDSRRRLLTNPLRILDSKNPAIAALLEGAPQLSDYLDEDSRHHWAQLLDYLDALELRYTINPYLVRGLDYYTKTVFEWVTTALGAQGTVCAGGRYDGLMMQLGGQDVPALGCAVGLERTLLLMQANDNHAALPPAIHVYLIPQAHDDLASCLQLAEQLRTHISTLNVVLCCTSGGLSSKLKKADASNARWAIIVGSAERCQGQATIKDLRSSQEQVRLNYEQLISHLRQQLGRLT